MKTYHSISCLSFNWQWRNRPRPGRHFNWG